MTSNYLTHADLGGTIGHGRIEPGPEGEIFHDTWEAKALALTLAAGAPGGWNIDTSRSARETLPGYLDLTYYEIWATALERLVVDHGLVTETELAAGHAATAGDAERRVLIGNQVAAALARGGPTLRESTTSARFAVGDRVRTRAGRVDHHTRLPAYASGKIGSIERVHGAHVFPDTNAHGHGEQPHWLYTVVFDATELWDDGRPGQRVSVDAWEPYLIPVERGLA